MNENQPGSTRIDAWFLSIAALVSTALALGCSGSDGRGQEKGGTKEIRTIVVRAAAFSPDAKLLVLATGPGAPSASAKLAPQRAMLLFDAESGKTLRGFELEKPANGVFFLEGGKKLLVWKN